MKKNLFEEISDDLPEELFTVLAEGDGVKVERIVSDGHASGEGFWYDQTQNEWVLVISGSAVLEFEDDVVELKAGDYIMISAHRRHRVKSTSTAGKTVWLAVFYD